MTYIVISKSCVTYHEAICVSLYNISCLQVVYRMCSAFAGPYPVSAPHIKATIQMLHTFSPAVAFIPYSAHVAEMVAITQCQVYICGASGCHCSIYRTYRAAAALQKGGPALQSVVHIIMHLSKRVLTNKVLSTRSHSVLHVNACNPQYQLLLHAFSSRRYAQVCSHVTCISYEMKVLSFALRPPCCTCCDDNTT